MSVILPGATIGILGGGQLGRMTAMAARSMGYRVQVLDPDPSCPARFVVDACFEGAFDDDRAAAALARGSDVVTLEIEQISYQSLLAAEKYAPVRPSAELMRIVQDRLLQKEWLSGGNFPIGRWVAALTEEQLVSVVTQSPAKFFLKSATGGYDGRSQSKLGFGAALPSGEEARHAWALLGGKPCVVEWALDLSLELSVMVARNVSGEVRAFPPAMNHHENQILDWSVIPLSQGLEMPDRNMAEIIREAEELSIAIAEKLGLEGLLAVEMFLTGNGELLVNELAPRPHNSYHASERACSTSQFEQAVRAICNLPLGSTEVIVPAAIANLLGDIWLERRSTGEEPRFGEALSVPGVRLHLYEKHIPRPGRKMGHLSAIGESPTQAVERVLTARRLL